MDNRLTVYSIRDLGAELSPITMLVMMESIQNRIIKNERKGRATWLYIDEFHVLPNSEYSTKYLQQLWKKVRKQGGLCMGITQNVVDLLQNYTATTKFAKLGVCNTAQAGKHGQFQNGRGYRCVGCTDSLRNKYYERHGAYEVRKCGSSL